MSASAGQLHNSIPSYRDLTSTSMFWIRCNGARWLCLYILLPWQDRCLRNVCELARIFNRVPFLRTPHFFVIHRRLGSESTQEIVSLPSCMRTRGLVDSWHWISNDAAGFFLFPFWPRGTFPFPFWGRRAFPFPFPHPRTSYPTLVGLICKIQLHSAASIIMLGIPKQFTKHVLQGTICIHGKTI